MMVADALAPNRRQAISNHHDKSAVTSATWTISCDMHITLQPLNKLCSREAGRSVIRLLLCCWRTSLVTKKTSIVSDSVFLDLFSPILPIYKLFPWHCYQYAMQLNTKYTSFWDIMCNNFYPRPVLAYGYCRCLRPSVRQSVRPSVTKFVRAITQHQFKLGLPNLDHRCKRPWLRSLLFWGVLTLTFKVKFSIKIKMYPVFSLSAR